MFLGKFYKSLIFKLQLSCSLKDKSEFSWVKSLDRGTKVNINNFKYEGRRDKKGS
jgi:hypothetical protein